MKIRTKFSLALLAVFVPGFLASAWISQKLLLDNAREEVERSAGLMMETAMSVRGYTIDQIKPHLDPMLETEFLPQTVPAFSAIETFERLRKKYPDFSYREAALNPTNLRDQASPWEARVIERFRAGEKKEVVGEIDRDGRRFLFVARPIEITNQACLACHSTPAAAPASLRTKYGDVNGFGWRMEEVIGAQIVTVPVELPYKNAKEVLAAFGVVLVVLFVALFVILNIMLNVLVVKPIQSVSRISDEISRGNMDFPEFEDKGSEEIRQLHGAFNRMRRSVEKAMKLLKH
jgi:HAMP domain-containing protein